MEGKNIYLIDATAFCYRAFYALKGLSTSFGQPTNAIYGFINILNKILKKETPDYLAVCFDVSRDTFRAKKFVQYKIQRPPMPEGLSSQLPLIKQVVSAYGIAMFEKEGFEADDIIATIARIAGEKGLSVTIVSSDKDILQLVSDNTFVYSPYKDAGTLYDTKKVIECFSVEPQKIIDLIALMGDAADNIPGIPGIGEKTARELMKNFGSLKQLKDNIDKVEPVKIKNSLAANFERLDLNRELVTLDKGVDIGFELEKAKIGTPDLKELSRLFKYLEFRSFLKGLPQAEDEQGNIALETGKVEDLKELLGKEKELFLYGSGPDDFIFCAGGKSFRQLVSEERLKGILLNPEVKKIGYDLKKIRISLAKDNVAMEGMFFDCKVAAYLLNPSRAQYGLSDIAWDYLGGSLSDETVDSEKAIGLLVRLKPKLEKELLEKSLFRLFSDLEMPLVEVLAQMELNGIKLDLEVMEKLSSDIEERLIKLVRDIYDISGSQFNINSTKQLRVVLFEKLKLPVIRRSKTGPSTDEEVLKALAAKHKLPELLLEYRQLTKLKNTYIDTLPQLVDPKTGRIHASFNQTATETGRLSSSNPNLQNVPIKTDIGRNIRRAIISSGKNNYIVSCDYSQIELRILAHLSKDENLTLAFKENKDIHKATASLIYGLKEEDILDQMREVAKRVNFGIVYGLTSYGLSRDLVIPVEEAQDFIDAYFLRYPKVREYINEQVDRAKKDGFVTTILGRRRYIPEINNKNQGIRQFAERQAVNTPIQGSASDLLKLAMLAIHQEARKRNWESRMLIQIHDELVFDVPAQEMRELTGLVRDRMENVLKLDVPIKVDIKKGKNWLEMEPV